MVYQAEKASPGRLQGASYPLSTSAIRVVCEKG
jgi:hypothetical protein